MCSGYTSCAAVNKGRGNFICTKNDYYRFEQDHAPIIKNHVRRETIFPIPTHLNILWVFKKMF